jgi:hypothetical protein
MALLLSILLAMCGQEASADRPAQADSAAQPRFQYPGLEVQLASISWRSLGHDLARLQPLLGRHAEQLRSRAPGDMQAADGDESLASLRRAVRSHIDRMAGTGISGTGPHGVFTHPAVFVNAVHFTLEDAHRPLTREQAEELFHLGGQYIEEERERVKEKSTETLALAQLLSEMKLRGRMLDWARTTLTPKQQSLLQPESTRDLMGWSYFSSVAVLGPHARPIAYVDRRQLVDALLRWHVSRFGFTESQAPAIRDVLERFVKELPAEPLQQGGRVGGGVLSGDYTVAVADKTADLRRALVADESLSWAQRDRIRKERLFAVPVRILAPLSGNR